MDRIIIKYFPRSEWFVFNFIRKWETNKQILRILSILSRKTKGGVSGQSEIGQPIVGGADLRSIRVRFLTVEPPDNLYFFHSEKVFVKISIDIDDCIAYIDCTF